MANIYHQVLIKAPEKAVYDAVTTHEGLSAWWIKDNTVKAEKDFVNTFNVEGYGQNRMKILQLESPAYVEWECINENDEWTGTRVIFRISTKGDFTCLDFRHNGYPSENEIYATCNYHWGRHLSMLKVYCETGKPQLDQDREKAEVDAVHNKK